MSKARDRRRRWMIRLRWRQRWFYLRVARLAPRAEFEDLFEDLLEGLARGLGGPASIFNARRDERVRETLEGIR